MFFWIASYPKSGNTLTRSLLASYFFSADGKFNFHQLQNIPQFPDISLFKRYGLNTKDEQELLKNYVFVQKQINKKNSIQFLKTHSCLFNINNNPFTNLNVSLGAIYIVRDPRNVLISAAHHYQSTQKKTADYLVKGYNIGKYDGKEIVTYTGDWAFNYNSWKSFREVNKYLLIKYEDLINDKEKSFYKILEFIYAIKNIDFVLDKKKFKNTLQSTDFQNMQKLENEGGFVEAITDEETGKKIKFFNLGKKTEWKKLLDPHLKSYIEKAFRKEMIELGYL